MIINHSHKFVFIHVPNGNSASVSMMLSGLTTYRDLEISSSELGQLLSRTYGRRFGLEEHMHASQVQRVMGEQDWSKYFTFGFVQNPFARLLSIYRWSLHDKRSGIPLFETFEEFLGSDVWLENAGPSGIFDPQTAWLTAKDDPASLIVDYVGRIETLAEGMDQVSLHFSDPVLFDISRLAALEEDSHTSIEWAGSEIDRVVERYQSDFAIFGYPTEPTPDLQNATRPRKGRNDSEDVVEIGRGALKKHRKLVRRSLGGWPETGVAVKDTGILLHPTLRGPSVVALDIELTTLVTGFRVELDSPKPLAPEIEFMVAVFRGDVELALDGKLPDPLPHDLALAATGWLPVEPCTEMSVELRLPLARIGPLQLVLATRVTGPTINYAHGWFRNIRALTIARRS